MNTNLSRILWGVVVSKKRMVEEVQKLRHENADLRARLAVAHRAKQQAEAQAEELRSQKERLRVKADELKKEMSAQRRMLDQTQAKNAELREELHAMKGDRKSD